MATATVSCQDCSRASQCPTVHTGTFKRSNVKMNHDTMLIVKQSFNSYLWRVTMTTVWTVSELLCTVYTQTWRHCLWSAAGSQTFWRHCVWLVQPLCVVSLPAAATHLHIIIIITASSLHLDRWLDDEGNKETRMLSHNWSLVIALTDLFKINDNNTKCSTFRTTPSQLTKIYQFCSINNYY